MFITFLAFEFVQRVFKAELTVIHVILSHLTDMIITKIRNCGKNGAMMLDCGGILTSSRKKKYERKVDLMI